MQTNLQTLIDLIMQGVREHFIADEIKISKIEKKEDKLVIEIYEEETEYIYRVVLFNKEHDNTSYIEGVVFMVKGIFNLGRLEADGYMKMWGLLKTFRGCEYFTKEEEDIL